MSGAAPGGRASAKRAAPLAVPAGFFALRTPLLPVDELFALAADLAAPAALAAAVAGAAAAATDAVDLATPTALAATVAEAGAGATVAAGDPLGAALASDRAAQRSRLRALVARPEVREALFVASPSLDESLRFWLDAPDGERGRKAERALVRYVARMAGRSTPFGLFAGCSVGAVDGGATRLRLGALAAYRRHTRLDMDYLFALTEALARDPAVRAALPLRPSTSLYRAAGRLRYAEARLDGEGGRSRAYHLVAVEPTPYLEATLARAATPSGARAGELAAALVADDPEVAPDEAAAFLDELVDSQLLVPDLAPAVTGPEPIHGLIDTLRGPAPAVADALDAARRGLDALDEAGLGHPAARYRAVAATLAGLPATPELPRLFQVDLVKPTPDARLGDAVVRELEGAIALLHRLTAPRETPLDRFRAELIERYEGEEVPLVDALDEESGIGFDASGAPAADAAPLLAGLAFSPSPSPSPSGAGEPLDARARHLARRRDELLRAGRRELVLDDADLDALAHPSPPPLPDAFALFGRLLAPSEQAIDRGDFRVVVEGLAAPSTSNLLARFCHADDRLHRAVLASLRAEEAHRPDAIYAEVVHLPEGRVGNVLLRPLLRAHELPFLGRSGAPRDRQIEVSDLLVSVVRGRVVLRSRRLGREVVPRLTTAHNFTRGLGVYRFLCALPHQGGATGGWSWGALGALPWLPRVRRGRLVLAPQRFALDAEELRPLVEARGDAALYRAAQSLRASRALPRHVAVADGDNLLPIDLDAILSVETFAQLVKERARVELTEAFVDDGDLCVRGPEGRFVNEIVVPFVRPLPGAASPPASAPSAPAPPDATPPDAESARARGVSSPATDEAPLVRRFAPGSEWLYAKLYTGTASADVVLRRVVSPLVAAARASGAADGWFFLRYGDPRWHVRLRLHGDPAGLAAEVLPALHAACAPLLASGELWRVALDTYEREVERYGGPVGVRLAERLFEADSDAALAIVDALEGDAGGDARWRLALVSFHRLFDDLGFDLARRRAVVAAARAGYASELRADAHLERQLGERYRRERLELERLLEATADSDHPLAPGVALLDARSAALRPIVAALGVAAAAGRLTVGIDELALSYTHLAAIRLLRSAARPHELVLHDLLGRLYDARAARARSGSSR